MKTILIAEDNDTNLKFYHIILKHRDIEILDARNGKEAVEICRRNPKISLVLMDIRMPIMGGEEAAILIKEINPNIIIISQTAYIAYGKVQSENEKYFDHFITKPINLEILNELMEKYSYDEN